MEKLRAIVVATDPSKDSARAARRATMLADALGLPLEWVHVASVRDAHARLVAASRPDTLLVIGARRRLSLRDFIFGAPMERLIRESAGPVLVVRSEARVPYRNILVGVDLERGCDSMLRDVVALSPGARMVALNAYRVPFEGRLRRAGVRREEIERQRGLALQMALDGIRALDPRPAMAARRVIPAAERGDPARLLVDHGKRIGADLVAVARRTRSFLEAFLVGSVARRVVADADRDVLVLRGPAPA
jgi:nucleotide-binding universal stress UspA family protein